MKKALCSLLIIILLCGCSNTGLATGTNILDDEIIREDKQLSFECESDYCWECESKEAKSMVKDDYARLTSEDYFQGEYKIGTYELIDIVPIGEDDTNEKIYSACCEWIAANYSTSFFGTRDRMTEGIEKRYSLLSDALKQCLNEASYSTKWVDERFEPAVRCKAASGGKGDFKSCRFYLKYNDGLNELNGYIFNFAIFIKSNNMKCLPQYITNNKIYAYFNTSYSNNKIDYYTWNIDFSVEVLVNSDGLICDFREIYQKADSKKTLYRLYGENEIIGGYEGLYYPPEPACVKDINSYYAGTTEETSKATEAGVKFYKALIGLSGNKSAFEALPLSKSFNKKSLDEMISDAEKYGVDFEIDPSSQKQIEDARFVTVYNSDEYGKVYMLQRNALMKTGNSEFNKKYGFNIDRQSSIVNIYLCEEDGEYKICAVKIFSLDYDLFSEESLNELWSGNGGKG